MLSKIIHEMTFGFLNVIIITEKGQGEKMLKGLLNKEVVITYQIGYSYSHKKGIVTKVGTDFLTIDNNTLLAVNSIVKIVIKEKK